MIFVRSESGLHTGVVIFHRYKYPSKEETSRRELARSFSARLMRIDREIKMLEQEKKNCEQALEYIYQNN